MKASKMINHLSEAIKITTKHGMHDFNQFISSMRSPCWLICRYKYNSLAIMSLVRKVYRAKVIALVVDRH